MHKLINRKADQEDKPPLIALQLITFPELCKTSNIFLKYQIFRLCYEGHIYQRTILHNQFLNLNRTICRKKAIIKQTSIPFYAIWNHQTGKCVCKPQRPFELETHTRAEHSSNTWEPNWVPIAIKFQACFHICCFIPSPPDHLLPGLPTVFSQPGYLVNGIKEAEGG